MREILFRGKRIVNNKWVEGGFHVWETRQPCAVGADRLKPEEIKYMITTNSFADWNMPRSMQAQEVIPETVGQYTGLKDKNGKRIFEGDIVHILGNQDVEDWKNVDYNALIAFIDGGFCAIDGTIEEHAFRRYALARMDFDLEVIGNIHDNPELLEDT